MNNCEGDNLNYGKEYKIRKIIKKWASEGTF